MSLFGLSRWQCACIPHPFEEYNSDLVYALGALEKLDLDRAYFKLASSEEDGRAVSRAAITLLGESDEKRIREWWVSVEGWVKTPSASRGTPPWCR